LQPDLRPLTPGDAASVAYGPLPYALFEQSPPDIHCGAEDARRTDGAPDGVAGAGRHTTRWRRSSIAIALVRVRLRAGLSQAVLAARMGISQSAIARRESGQTLPSTKTLLRFAQATGSRFQIRPLAAA
jgi:DNA-binding XRE family transcriptional regulator